MVTVFTKSKSGPIHLQRPWIDVQTWPDSVSSGDPYNDKWSGWARATDNVELQQGSGIHRRVPILIPTLSQKPDESD